MDTSNLFWFNNLNLEPDYELTIENKNVEKLVKQMELEATAKNDKPILYDPIISDKLHASVFYISMGKKNKLLECIYENCSITIDTSKLYDIFFYVKLNLGIGTYIFVESKKFSERKLSVHCYWTQRGYNSYLLTNMHNDFKNFTKSKYLE